MGKTCELTGCCRPAARRGKCWRHLLRPKPLPSRYCEAPDCGRLAIYGHLCEGHRKQLRRHGRVLGPLGPPAVKGAGGRFVRAPPPPEELPEDPVKAVLAAAVLYADAPAEDAKAYDRAVSRLLQTCARFQRHLERGHRPVPARPETARRGEEGTPEGETG